MMVSRVERRESHARSAGSQTSIQRWFRAVRFPSFTTSTVPIVVASGLALVDGVFDPLLFVVMLMASMLVHAGCNLANDYYDHRRGVDTADSLGPSGVIQKSLLSAAQVRTGMLVCFMLATLLGLWIVTQAGPGIFWLALASLAAAFLYTGGPAPLAYLALGEVTVLLAMGIGMVGGAYYVYSGELSTAALLLGTAVGLQAAAILHANNVRDIETDRDRGKRTLANLLPRRVATVEYGALIAGAYAFVALAIVVAPALWPLVLVGLSVPRALRLVTAMGEDSATGRGLRRSLPAPRENVLHLRNWFRPTGDDPALLSGDDPVAAPSSALRLNRLLRLTAGLHLRFGLLTTAGLLIATGIEHWS